MADSLEKFYMSAEGWYDPASQMRAVFSDKDPRSSISLMVSNHEIYHSHLATTTGFGTVSILIGALVHLGHSALEPLFNQLMIGSLLCHEEYATISSIFVTGKGDFDDSLLENYPQYQAYRSAWQELRDLAPHPLLAQVAIENLTRAAMQGGIDHQLSRYASDEWHSFRLKEEDAPSERLYSLRDVGFLKVLFRAKPDFHGGKAHLADRLIAAKLSDEESCGLLHSEEGQEFLDEFAYLYFRLAQNRLQSQGQTCLDFNGHSQFTDPLITKAQALAGETVLLPFRRPHDDESPIDQVSSELAQEYLMLSDEPYNAIFADIRDVEELGADFVLGGTDGKKWVQILAVPKCRLYAQYRFEDESAVELEAWEEETITCLRRRIIDEDTGRVQYVELLAIPDIETLQHFAGQWGELERATASMSVLAMQSDEWLNTWLPVFRGMGPIPVLVDSDPFSMMRRWNKAGLSVHCNRLSMAFENSQRNQERKIEVFAWKVGDEPMIFFCPISGALSSALQRYARRLGENFSVNGEFIQDAMNALIPAVSHLLQEERQFGFGWRDILNTRPE